MIYFARIGNPSLTFILPKDHQAEVTTVKTSRPVFRPMRSTESFRTNSTITKWNYTTACTGKPSQTRATSTTGVTLLKLYGSQPRRWDATPRIVLAVNWASHTPFATTAQQVITTLHFLSLSVTSSSHWRLLHCVLTSLARKLPKRVWTKRWSASGPSAG